jgi:hypothetical protein
VDRSAEGVGSESRFAFHVEHGASALGTRIGGRAHREVRRHHLSLASVKMALEVLGRRPPMKSTGAANLRRPPKRGKRSHRRKITGSKTAHRGITTSGRNATGAAISRPGGQNG